MDIEEYRQYQQLYDSYMKEKIRGNELAMSKTSSVFQKQDDVNLIEFQLDLNDILERCEHLLRGHVIENDGKGGVKWVESDDDRFKVFNEYGVQEILRILSMYLNRNTILSNYDENTINLKVYDLGYDIVDLIFMKYEEMFFIPSYSHAIFKLYGIKRNTEEDDEGRIVLENKGKLLVLNEKLEFKVKDYIEKIMQSKIKLYMIIVRQVVDSVHSAYLRALNGGERESLRTARHVTQADNPMQMPTVNNIMPSANKSRWYNPFSWGK